MLGLAGACLLAMIMRDTALLVLYALASGLGLGIGYVFDGAVWTNMFGRRFQGEIRGFVFTAGIIGSAIGPALFGLSFDHAGGYEPALALGAAARHRGHRPGSGDAAAQTTMRSESYQKPKIRTTLVGATC